ncbi:hypothetical protein BDR04DRAFT_180368 [Suillus decipiens]|nr:hypothetical protein BDR04DRAFT_180368 [Suillus decipiens]
MIACKLVPRRLGSRVREQKCAHEATDGPGTRSMDSRHVRCELSICFRMGLPIFDGLFLVWFGMLTPIFYVFPHKCSMTNTYVQPLDGCLYLWSIEVGTDIIDLILIIQALDGSIYSKH